MTILGIILFVIVFSVNLAILLTAWLVPSTRSLRQSMPYDLTGEDHHG